MLSYGDSKTWMWGWQPLLAAQINAAHPALRIGWGPTDPPNGLVAPVIPGALGRNGATVASMKATVDADLAQMTDPTDMRYVIVNLGVNDFAALPAEAAWNADLAYILDALHAKYPAATIAVTRPWNSGNDANADTLAARIATVVAARPGWAILGDDERAWLKPNVATYSYDGTHYSAAGMVAAAQARFTALGFTLP